MTDDTEPHLADSLVGRTITAAETNDDTDTVTLTLDDGRTIDASITDPGASWEAVSFSELSRRIDERDRKLLQNGVDRNDVQADQVLEQYGTWAVTEYGLEHLAGNYGDTGSGHYAIERDSVHSGDWELHMAEKRWCHMYDFLRALYDARSRWPRAASGSA